MREKDGKFKELVVDNRRLRKEKDSTEKELVTERSDNTKLRKAAESREVEYGYLNKRLNEIRMENQELKRGAEDKAKLVEALRKGTDRLQLEISTFKETSEQKLRDSMGMLETTRREMGSLQRENSILRAELEIREKGDREKKQEVINRTRQTEKLKKEVERLLGENSLLKKESEVKEKESKAYVCSLDPKMERMITLGREVEDLQKKNSKLRKDMEEMGKDVKDKEQRLEEVMGQSRLLKEEAGNRHQEEVACQMEIDQDRPAKMMKIRQNLANLEMENNGLRAEKEKMQSIVDTYEENETRMKDSRRMERNVNEFVIGASGDEYLFE